MADSKSEDDIFVKEVEEEIKQENLLNLWKRFGKIIIGVVTLFIIFPPIVIVIAPLTEIKKPIAAAVPIDFLIS